MHVHSNDLYLLHVRQYIIPLATIEIDGIEQLSGRGMTISPEEGLGLSYQTQRRGVAVHLEQTNSDVRFYRVHNIERIRRYIMCYISMQK